LQEQPIYFFKKNGKLGKLPLIVVKSRDIFNMDFLHLEMVKKQRLKIAA
jgi:hypothetical protein